MTIEIRPNTRIVLIGDSVTDSDRGSDPSGLGFGYVSRIAGEFGATHPRHDAEFINRGVAGDRVGDLVERWGRDVIDENPDVVSIMIGVNDTWRRFDDDDPTSAEVFQSGYRELLDRTARRADTQVVLIEPFLLPINDAMWAWRDDLDPKIQVVRRLAYEYGATLLAADGLFAQAGVRATPKHWADDGIHPCAPGHSLLANAWLAHARTCD